MRARGIKRIRIRKTTQHRIYQTASECLILWSQRLQISSMISYIQETMNLVSWNCRGMGGSIKVEALKNIINTEKPDVLLIQDTKMPEDEFLSRSPLF